MASTKYQENIHIAIIGPVSAGKSTLLNALFAHTYSDMKRKKTTMLPQIYKTVNSGIIHTEENIKQLNTNSNNNILHLRETGTYNQSHFEELQHIVNPISDFIVLPDTNATYSILDMPGLNCSGDGNKIYYDYLLNNSHMIDIYILVFDINSALNTTDEENILKQVKQFIEKNKHGYVHVLINKCDEIEFKSTTKFSFADVEVKELYERSIEIVDKNLKDIRGHCTKSPICASELYVYRGAINNINSLDETQIDNIIKSECGKQQFIELKRKGIDVKKKFVLGLIKEKKICNDWMKDTGYYLFKNSLNEILSNYKKIILYHIEQDTKKLYENILNSFDPYDTDKYVNELCIIKERLQKCFNCINTTITEQIPISIKTILDNITNRINTIIIDNITLQQPAKTIITVNTFIDKVKLFINKISHMFTQNPFKLSLDKLVDTRIELLNNELTKVYNTKIFEELYINKTLNIANYATSINNTLIKSLANDQLAIPLPDTITFKDLIKSVNIITNSDIPLLHIIIESFLQKYTHTTFNDFMSTLEIITNATKKNIDVILNVFSYYFKNLNNIKLAHYINWMRLYQHKIACGYNEIQYIYYKLYILITGAGTTTSSNNIYLDIFDNFKNTNNDMNKLYSLMLVLFKKLPVIVHNANANANINTNNNTDDEFLDAEEQYTTNINNNNCNDDDNNDDIYNNTMKKIQVKTAQRVLNGT